MNNIQALIQRLVGGLNPLQIYSAIKQSSNPQQLVIGAMKKYGGNNPMVNGLVELAENNDAEGIEKFARNICKENGVDYDTEFAKFKEKLGINQ